MKKLYLILGALIACAAIYASSINVTNLPVVSTFYMTNNLFGLIDGSPTGLVQIPYPLIGNWQVDQVTNAAIPGKATMYSLETTGSPSGENTFGGSNVFLIALSTPVAFAGQFQQYQDSITHAGTITIDFSSTNAHALTITGDVTFATSGLATNRTARLKITGCSTNSVPTFPGTWNFLGGAPTVITANKVSMLSLEAWGTTDASVVAAFQEAK